ncbi:hypothetical protein LT493_24145 [Streptomyces tricolor]|nr:hypothetical protein [Streptomyces tricolor]
MIFGNKGRERFLDAVAGFEAAVRERDADRSQQHFQDMHRFFGEADDQEFHRPGHGSPGYSTRSRRDPAPPSR